MRAEKYYLLSVDIGGTFTDIALMDVSSGELNFVKLPTTPTDFSFALIEGLERIQKQTGIETDRVMYVVHGSTIGINIIIQRKGAKTGLITTEGFRDIPLIGRQSRPKIYRWNVGRPRPLTPRNLVMEVPERILHTGKVSKPINEDKAREALRELKKHDVESVAVCLLHSYVNNINEIKLKKIIEEELPGAFISVSSELIPEFREYERLSTTLMNAYIGPIVSKYFDNVERILIKNGINQLLIMLSNGGMSTPEVAKRCPVGSIESGPAAGVIAAAYLGKLIGRKDVISLDMGGTTAKTSLIHGGEPRVTSEYEVLPMEVGEQIIRGTGYPVKTPVIDLIEVGSGGGSIAWIDAGGALRVGPQSAGAYPGPVCYKMGGTEPTVTDANVVLRRINPDYFLGGEMKIDGEASYEVIKQKISEKLGLGVEESAEGMIDVSNSTMARSIRYVSVERGYDPRDFTLVAFGGAAPTQVCQLADVVGIPEIVVPKGPGLFSAIGMLVADLRHDYVRTCMVPEDGLDLTTLNQLYEDMEKNGKRLLQKEGNSSENMKLLRSADMRYTKQSYELNVPVPGGILRENDISSIIKRFHELHERQYGFFMPNEKTVLVNVRLTAIGTMVKPKLKVEEKGPESPDKALKGTRDVYFREEGWISCPIYERDKLAHGNLIKGPAVIEESDSTIVIFPGFETAVDNYGNIIMRRLKR